MRNAHLHFGTKYQRPWLLQDRKSKTLRQSQLKSGPAGPGQTRNTDPPNPWRKGSSAAVRVLPDGQVTLGVSYHVTRS